MATSTKVRWLAKPSEIQMYDHEIYHLKDGQPASMVRTLYALPEGGQYKRGYKAPRCEQPMSSQRATCRLCRYCM